MAPGEVKAIMTTDPMVVLISKEGSSRSILIIFASYDNVQQKTILSIQEIKAAEMEMRKRLIVKIPNRDG